MVICSDKLREAYHEPCVRNTIISAIIRGTAEVKSVRSPKRPTATYC